MARRKQPDSESALFPFLSILVCLIGILVLVIVALALQQMDTQDLKDIERAQQNAELTKQIKQDEEKKDELAELIKQARQIKDALEAAQRELDRLKAAQEDKDKAEEQQKQDNIKLLAEADDLLKRIEALKKQLEEILAEIEKLKKEIEDRKKPPDPAAVVIKPSGSGRGLEPVFIECTARDVVLLDDPEKLRYPGNGNLLTNLELIAYIDSIAVDPTKRLVLLVREDAWGSYVYMDRLAKARNCPAGKLPVPGQGLIDLKMFKALRK